MVYDPAVVCKNIRHTGDFRALSLTKYNNQFGELGFSIGREAHSKE